MHRSTGIVVDAGGTDARTRIDGNPRAPATTAPSGWEADGSTTEHGGAVAGSGASGFGVTVE